MYGATNIVFMVCASIGALLVAIPLPKALASGNIGTSMVIIWTEVACLVQLVNAIRWNHSIENWAPVWCDFCGYFLVTTDLALVASGLSINRRLYMIATLKFRKHERMFNVVVDIVLCLVIPLVSIPLQYVVQQYRFYIFEDVGCLPGVGNVDLAFPLVWMLPLFVGIVSTGYACLIIRASLSRNHELTGEGGMDSAWSRRLMAIGVVSTIYGLIPTSVAIALLATTSPVTPWPGWKAIHSTIDVIVYVPARQWQSSTIWIASAELRRWAIVTLAFVVFMFLGLTADMKKVYRAPFRSFNDSSSQIGGRAVPERNADGDQNDQKDPRSSRFRRNRSLLFGKTHKKSLRESFGLPNRPRLDSDLEGFQLVFPISHADVTHPTYTSWKPRLEEDGSST